MKRIIIPNYVPTLIKGSYVDLEVTYTGTAGNCTIDEVFCDNANLTSLLADASIKELESELSRILVKEITDARDALAEQYT